MVDRRSQGMLTPRCSMKNRNQPHPSSREWVKTLGLFGVIVSELVAFTGAGLFLGYWAWDQHGFPWWILVVSSLCGLVFAFIRIKKVVERIHANSDEEKPS